MGAQLSIPAVLGSDVWLGLSTGHIRSGHKSRHWVASCGCPPSARVVLGIRHSDCAAT